VWAGFAGLRTTIAGSNETAPSSRGSSVAGKYVVVTPSTTDGTELPGILQPDEAASRDDDRVAARSSVAVAPRAVKAAAPQGLRIRSMIQNCPGWGRRMNCLNELMRCS